MSDPETHEPKTPNLTDLAVQVANILQNTATQTSTNSTTVSPLPLSTENLTISVKLNGNNYAIWAPLVLRAIIGRGRRPHLTGVPPPPPPTDPRFPAWEQTDNSVFTWIIQTIEPTLVMNVTRYPTAKALWDGLALTYGSGTDSLRVYDLHRRASLIRQGGGSIESCWNKLQDLWTAMDAQDPNHMTCIEDINIHNRKMEALRLFQFLTAIDDKYTAEKNDLLKRDPLPSLETAYREIRRPEGRAVVLQGIPSEDSSSLGIGQGLATRRRTNRGPVQGRSRDVAEHKEEDEGAQRLHASTLSGAWRTRRI